jgi:hypothetical protein
VARSILLKSTFMNIFHGNHSFGACIDDSKIIPEHSLAIRFILVRSIAPVVGTPWLPV